MLQEELGHEKKNLDEKLDEMINGMPEEAKEELIEGITAIQRTQSMSIPAEAIVMSKITEEHISDYLAASKENMQRTHDGKRDDKIFAGFLSVIALVFIIVVIVLLRDKPEIMEKIIYIVLGFLGGAAGGYGLGKRKESNGD